MVCFNSFLRSWVMQANRFKYIGMNPNHLQGITAPTRRRVGRYMRLESDDYDDATIKRYRLEQ